MAEDGAPRHADGRRYPPGSTEDGFFDRRCGGTFAAVCLARVLAAVVDDLAVFDFDDAVGVVGDVAVVGDEDDGVAFGVQFAEDFHHFFAAVAVERAGGFVGEDDLPAVHQGAGDGDALLLPAGKLTGFVLGVVAEAEASQQRLGARFAHVRRRAGVNSGNGDVFPGLEVGEQVVALEDEADVFAA